MLCFTVALKLKSYLLGEKRGSMPLIVIMQVQGMRVIRTNKNDKSLENSIHSLEAKIFLKYEENKLQHEIHANSLLIIWKNIHVTNTQVQQGFNESSPQGRNRLSQAGKCFQLELFIHVRKLAARWSNQEGKIILFVPLRVSSLKGPQQKCFRILNQKYDRR